MRGGDRTRFLNSLATNCLDDLKPGEGRETFLTDSKGRIVAHGMVLADEDLTSFSLGHVNKRLTLVRFLSGQLANVTLSFEGKPVGATTSVGFSPECACPVALAYVRREQAELGTVLESPMGPTETAPFSWMQDAQSHQP